MYKHFNKLGNIEVVNNIMKYRIGIENVPEADKNIIENELKKKYLSVENDVFVNPMQIEFMNRFLVIYYNMEHLHTFDRLREFKLMQNIPYYLSLVELGKLHETGLRFSWERLNFVIDEYQEKVRIVFVETPSLKLYEQSDTRNVIEFVRDMIISTLTLQSTFLTLPKRHDFLDASERNVAFVERLYKIENLDDMQMYLETVALDLEQNVSLTEAAEDEPKVKTQKIKKSKPSKKKNSPKKQPMKKQNQNNKRFDKKILILLGILPFVFGFYFFAMSTGKTTNEAEKSIDASKPITETFSLDTENKKVLEAYQAVYNSDFQTAYELLNSLEKKEISKDDINLLIDVYFKNEKSAELLDLYPNVANVYIIYLVKNNLITKLEEYTEGMTTENPYILFEIAYLKNDYETVLLNKDKVDLNARRESQIVTAMLATGALQEALEFANSTGNPELIKQVESASLN